MSKERSYYWSIESQGRGVRQTAREVVEWIQNPVCLLSMVLSLWEAKGGVNGTDAFHLDDLGLVIFMLLSGECGTEKDWFSIYNMDYIGGVIPLLQGYFIAVFLGVRFS